MPTHLALNPHLETKESPFNTPKFLDLCMSFPAGSTPDLLNCALVARSRVVPAQKQIFYSLRATNGFIFTTEFVSVGLNEALCSNSRLVEYVGAIDLCLRQGFIVITKLATFAKLCAHDFTQLRSLVLDVLCAAPTDDLQRIPYFVASSPPDMISPEQAYLDIIKAGGKTTEPNATIIFDKLKPIQPSFLLGEWEGADFDTGHHMTQQLKTMKWAGKTFHSEDNVEPIIVHGADGKRTFLEEYGHARIREIKHRGVVSAAMIYDEKPIIDYFRYVDENTVAGMMDWKNVAPNYHFHLTRCVRLTSGSS
ncbi:hypothetical protein R3P38DRAFT_3174890 [Favolaschia claudopus]|uniref:Uncharacterized protein n=1 Tax=Favolaschia claudopus TaxID=2862362 RepID=A0AAW0D820_9AGAR